MRNDLKYFSRYGIRFWHFCYIAVVCRCTRACVQNIYQWWGSEMYIGADSRPDLPLFDPHVGVSGVVIKPSAPKPGERV
jgi:hypothetical protein